MENDNKKHIGDRIRHQRELLNLTREKFAEQADISPQFLSELEKGKKGMSSDTLYKICNQFGLSADYLLFGNSRLTEPQNPIDELIRMFPDYSKPIIEDILRNVASLISVMKLEDRNNDTDSNN